MSSAPAIEETLAELWPAIEAALQWIDGPGDPDGDGFVEYQRATEQGLANQGWKDSFDAIFHADGTLAEGYIALCEVQGYVFAGKRLAARCARRLGIDGQGRAGWRPKRSDCAERFEEAFWCEELGTYALALDGAKQPCRVRTSNAGQLLFTGIVRDDRARLVAADLMSQKFFSGWGIRTVARGEARYNPMSYHDGSIWPHDNALIALGFARYGLKHSVAHLFKGLFDAASYMDLRRLPELFCGFQRETAARSGALSGRLRAAGLGERHALHACWRRRSVSNSTPRAARSGCAIRGCRNSSTRWCCAICSSAPSSVDLRVRRHDERGVARGVANARPDSGVDRADALNGIWGRHMRMQEATCAAVVSSAFASLDDRRRSRSRRQTTRGRRSEQGARSAGSRKTTGAAAIGHRDRRQGCAWHPRSRCPQRRQ